MSGILAVFNNCAPGPGDDYEQWYNRQHLFERLSVPGFLSGRRYEARSGDRRYFSYYETVGDAVLRSAPIPPARKADHGERSLSDGPRARARSGRPAAF
jgi:hypothetical protein